MAAHRPASVNPRTRLCSTTLSAEMSSAEQNFLQRLITESNFTGNHLEIGTAAGGTLCNMMNCFSDQTRPRFVVVDRMTYFDRQAEIVQENLQRHGLPVAGVEFRQASSEQAYRVASKQQDRFDFMLVDASHKLRHVMADLRWLRLLNVGGIACFHDYAPPYPGVKLSLDRFLSRYDNYEMIDVVDSLLAIRKTGICPAGEINFSDSAYSVVMAVPLAIERKMQKWKRRNAA